MTEGCSCNDASGKLFHLGGAILWFGLVCCPSWGRGKGG